MKKTFPQVVLEALGTRTDGLDDRVVAQEFVQAVQFLVEDFRDRQRSDAGVFLKTEVRYCHQAVDSHDCGLEEVCAACQHYVPGGQCRLVQGEISPEGHCDSWKDFPAPKGLYRGDDDTPIKYVKKWKGLELGITHRSGMDERHGKPMKADYGHVRGTYGQADDGMALDIYMGKDDDSDNVFKIRQLVPETGEVDEHKYVLGCQSSKEARDLYLKHMPPQFFGGLETASLDELKPQKKDAFNPPKQVLNWQGFSLGITHRAGMDKRFGYPMMGASYGYLRGSYGSGADGKSLDVYVGPDLDSQSAYKIRQLDPNTGFPDEDKYMVGFGSPQQAIDTYLYHVPRTRFGGIEPVDLNDLAAFRKDAALLIPSGMESNVVVHLDDCGCDACAVKRKKKGDPLEDIELGVQREELPAKKFVRLKRSRLKSDSERVQFFVSPRYVVDSEWQDSDIHEDTKPKRWQPGKVWVKNPELKGGGFFRKIPITGTVALPRKNRDVVPQTGNEFRDKWFPGSAFKGNFYFSNPRREAMKRDVEKVTGIKCHEYEWAKLEDPTFSIGLKTLIDAHQEGTLPPDVKHFVSSHGAGTGDDWHFGNSVTRGPKVQDFVDEQIPQGEKAIALVCSDNCIRYHYSLKTGKDLVVLESRGKSSDRTDATGKPCGNSHVEASKQCGHPDAKLNDRPDGKATRYDIHLEGKNVAYARVEDKGDRHFLESIKVHRDYRKQGLGSQLLRHVLDKHADKPVETLARSFERDSISHEALEGFYQKHGFQTKERDVRGGTLLRREVRSDAAKIDKDTVGYNYEDDGFACSTCDNWEGYNGEEDADEHQLGTCKLVAGKLWGLASCDRWVKDGKTKRQDARRIWVHDPETKGGGYWRVDPRTKAIEPKGNAFVPVKRLADFVPVAGKRLPASANPTQLVEDAKTGQRLIRKHQPLDYAVNEVAAAEIGHAAGIPTNWVQFHAGYSFHQLVPGQSVFQARQKQPQKYKNVRIQLSSNGTTANAEAIANMMQHPDLAKIVALDVFTGNEDRHGGNFMVAGKGKKQQYTAIDNGFAFQSSEPTRRFRQACDELNRSNFFAALDDEHRGHLKTFVEALKTLDQQNSVESLEKKLIFYNDVAKRQQMLTEGVRNPRISTMFQYHVESNAKNAIGTVRSGRQHIQAIIAALEPHTQPRPPQRDEIAQIIDPHGILE